MMNDFHLVHCGQFALRGAALVTMGTKFVHQPLLKRSVANEVSSKHR